MLNRTSRYLGLELSGAKNNKTTLATLEYYPKEKKIFVIEIHEGIGDPEQKTNDKALVQLIKEQAPLHTAIGINVPLTLPPCMTCVKKSCPLPSKCSVPSVKWMRKISGGSDFTPYTQRPSEIWIKHKIFQNTPERLRFEIDEALGGSRAPLTARMHFLKKHLKPYRLIEAHPKLTLSQLAQILPLEARLISSYRKLEEGAHAREKILDTLCEKEQIFIYQKDIQKLSEHLTTFDAFTCALTALYSDRAQILKMPKNFPDPKGWIHTPC